MNEICAGKDYSILVSVFCLRDPWIWRWRRRDMERQKNLAMVLGNGPMYAAHSQRLMLVQASVRDQMGRARLRELGTKS